MQFDVEILLFLNDTTHRFKRLKFPTGSYQNKYNNFN